MSDLSARIAEIINPTVEALGYQLVRVSFGGGHKAILQIMAERPDGSFSIEDCETLSRDVSAVLDVEDPISTEYVLEVSSPGIDRPLVRPLDYQRNIGFDAKVTAIEQIDGRRRFSGVIKDVHGDETVTLSSEDGDYDIPFAQIEKAKLILTDALIKAHQKGEKPQVN